MCRQKTLDTSHAAHLPFRSRKGSKTGAAMESLMLSRFRANAKRLQRDIDMLGTFGQVGPTAITRLAFTPADKAAHDHVAELMREAGMSVFYDAFGNVFGERAGTDARAKPVVTGSHLDGPPNG